MGKKRTASTASSSKSKSKQGNKKNAPAANKKQKVVPKEKPAVKHDNDDQDVEVGEEDREFFENHATASNFLMRMDPKALSKQVQSKKDVKKVKEPVKTEEDDSVPFEKLEAMPRKAQWEKHQDDTNKLPVKLMDGSIRFASESSSKPSKPVVKQKVATEEPETEDNDDELDSDVSEMEFEEVQDDTGKEEEAPVEQPKLSQVDLQKQRLARLRNKKIEIAQLSESILESPEEALRKDKTHEEELSKMQQLQNLTKDPDLTVQKLSMLSMLSVLLDILPDYRIRVLNNDNEMKDGKSRPLKKQVKQLQDYERSLLNAYQTFLKYCSKVATDGLKKLSYQTASASEQRTPETADEQRALSLAEVGVKCLSELLQKKYAFNFHLNLIIALVPFADAGIDSLRKPACTAFEAVFRADKSFSSSLEIVKQVSSYVKQKQHRVKGTLLDAFLRLPLAVTMEEGEQARKRAKSDRKKRKKSQHEHGDAIAANLKEAEAVVDPNEKGRAQADILHELVLIYFRILKQATYSQALPAVLRGLAKFAFLINLDIMIDLLKVLKVGLKEDAYPLDAALNAILVGLKTLQGPGQELLVDEKEFIDVLYRLLPRLSSTSVDELKVALECVEVAFLRRKEIVVDRVAAFVKRLLAISCHLPPAGAIATLVIVRSLFHRYRKVQQLLEGDADRVVSGEYRGDVDDPDFANPYASACWELTLLQKHWHPAVVTYAKATAQLLPSAANESTEALLEKYAHAETATKFEPRVKVPGKNPLHDKQMKEQHKNNKQRRRNRTRQFFIQDPLATGKLEMTSFLTLCTQVDEDKKDLE